MEISKKLKTFSAGIFFSATLMACTTSSDSDGIVLPGSSDNVPSPSDNQNSSISQEFLFNYNLLDIFYLYAHTHNMLNPDINAYINSPDLSSYGTSLCTSEYKDVCYMYSQMGDPRTRYFDPNYAASFYNFLMTPSSSIGIGAEIEFAEGDSLFVFTQVYTKSPADSAGIAVNDTLLSVDNTVPGSKKAAEALLSGSVGDSLLMEIKRGEDTLSLNVTIKEFITPTVFLSFQDSIPIIQITQFSNNTVSDSGTYGEFLDALKKTEGAASTIIDLRDNPGGDGDQCNLVSSALLSNGDTIIINIETKEDSIIQNGKAVYIQKFDTVTYTNTVEGIGKDRYYVFIADSSSASCAEVMLSAITVNRKSPVVGLTSYGKGIGQIYTLTWSNGLALITAATSMDKNGDSFHGLGIVPDFETGDEAEQMAKAVEWAKGRTKVREAGYGTESTGNFALMKRHTEENGIPTNRKEFLRQMGGKIISKKN